MEIHHERHNLIMLYNPEFRYSAGKAEYFHWHENIEFLYVLCDDFRVLIDGTLYTPQKGDLLFIREHFVHCFFSGEQDAVMRLGQISLSVLLGGGAQLMHAKTHITAQEIAEDPVFEKRLYLLLELMQSIDRVTKAETDVFARNVFSAFYFAVAQKFPEEKQSSSIKKERREFYKIIEYIRENITKEITIVSIAKNLYMDRGKVSRVFLKYSGVSLNDYVNKLRVDRANELLQEGVSVMQAALESGFQSVRTFNNTYRKIMGTTPTAYAHKK